MIPSAIQKLLNTKANWESLPLRLALAIMLFPHGLQKISNFSGMIDILGGNYGLPTMISILVILIEFFTPILLLIGLGTRLSAILIAIVMLGAIPYHMGNGFFMNWFGNQAGEGYQFHILAIGTAIGLAIIGGGNLSLDKRFFSSNVELTS